MHASSLDDHARSLVSGSPVSGGTPTEDGGTAGGRRGRGPRTALPMARRARLQGLLVGSRRDPAGVVRAPGTTALRPLVDLRHRRVGAADPFRGRESARPRRHDRARAPRPAGAPRERCPGARGHQPVTHTWPVAGDQFTLYPLEKRW
ncbi:hypothetical protein GCM10009767_17630 [Kocuria aegyptia]|uniref:Uncharacterized protein n=1 Tax=Kocuria aegyptia TaxID=330943 RepID=A0ABN2KLJ5_9MICC